jgi:hypothetical protein
VQENPEQRPEIGSPQGELKADRIAHEREALIHGIAVRATGDLRAKVGYILNHFPDARNSDVTLARRVWETFYPEYIDSDRVRLEDMYHLPRQTTITRTRAKIQNEYKLFRPNEEVASFRRTLRKDTAEAVVADRPGPPVIAVHADESGKSQRYLVVGSVWIVDVGKEWRVAEALREWKAANGIKGELKFADLSKDKLPRAMGYVKKAMEQSDMVGFKACVLDTHTVKGSPEDVLFRLYYELAMSGMEHEVAAGRVLLPRWLSFVKDADDGPDALRLPDFERRLTARCREYFRDAVRVDSIMTANSNESPLLQLADLFSGSVSRVVNKAGESTNHKDEFAGFFQALAGFDFTTEHRGGGDFIYVHHLGVGGTG